MSRGKWNFGCYLIASARFVLSVQPSAWRDTAVTTERDFMQFGSSVLSENLPGNIQIHRRPLKDISLILMFIGPCIIAIADE